MKLSSVASFTVLLALASGGAHAGEERGAIDLGHGLLREAGSETTLAIGDRVPDLRFRDLGGAGHRLSDGLAQAPTVFVFLSTRCPLAKRYTTRLRDLAKSRGRVGVRVVAIYPNADETREGIREHVERAGFEFPVVHDASGHLARALGASMTPQAFVVDAEGRLRYRGAIDDNRFENRVSHRWLAEALDALAAGGEVEVSSTRALGCTTHLAEAPTKEEVTYSRHVARILQDNCQSCHRAGQVGPFELSSFEDAKTWAHEIRAYTGERLMPPWKAARGVNRFLNDMSLSDTEIETIARWVEAGAPQGDPAETPPAPRFREGWAFGEPDQVFEMPEEYVIEPEGEDDYRHFVIPYDFGEHRFVRAIDVRPGNAQTVHHVLVYVDTSGKARELDAEDPGPGYTRFGGLGFEPVAGIGGWAPGNFPLEMPQGTGRWMPPKGDLVIQVHYYRTGLRETDRTKIGVWFRDEPTVVPARTLVVIDREFEVPAGASRHEVRASLEVEEDGYAFGVTPHMHLIGQDMKVVARRADGRVIPLIEIPRWDFNWQTSYRFREPIHLPKGTRLELVAHFDNSAGNPNNPNDPPALITWGEKTTDEMCIAFVGWLRASEYDPDTRSRRVAAAP